MGRDPPYFSRPRASSPLALCHEIDQGLAERTVRLGQPLDCRKMVLAWLCQQLAAQSVRPPDRQVVRRLPVKLRRFLFPDRDQQGWSGRGNMEEGTLLQNEFVREQQLGL